MPDIEWIVDQPADTPPVNPKGRRRRWVTSCCVAAVAGAFGTVMLADQGGHRPHPSSTPTSSTVRSTATVQALAVGGMGCGTSFNADKVDTVDLPLTVSRPVTVLSARLVRPSKDIALVAARLRKGCGTGSVAGLPRLIPSSVGRPYLELVMRVARDCGLPTVAVLIRYRSGSTIAAITAPDVSPFTICIPPGRPRQ